jgi:hypothetical protein
MRKHSNTGEDTYRDVLILHVPDALQNSSSDSIAQVLRGGLRMYIAQIYRPV